MPIVPSIPTRRISQDEFGALAYEVMSHVFAIHDDFGRLFDETIYKKELAGRMNGVELEVPVEVVHDTFRKTCFADAVVRGCGLFEFKASEAIVPRHRAQGIHYLRLFDLAHGKIINVRPEEVKHEFVNSNLRLSQLRQPQVHLGNWAPLGERSASLRDMVMALLADWGTGLDVSLYEEAVTHLLGGETAVFAPVPVLGTTGHLADQRMRLASPEAAFKITTYSEPDEAFHTHARRLLSHTPLKAIHWINIANHHVTFATIHA